MDWKQDVRVSLFCFCLPAGPRIWSSGGGHSGDYFRLQPRAKSWRHWELSDSRRGSLQRHPQQIWSLLQVSQTMNCFQKTPFQPFFYGINHLISLFYRIVCETTSSRGERNGQASVKVRGGGLGLSAQIFSFQVNAAHEYINIQGKQQITPTDFILHETGLFFFSSVNVTEKKIWWDTEFLPLRFRGSHCKPHSLQVEQCLSSFATDSHLSPCSWSLMMASH